MILTPIEQLIAGYRRFRTDYYEVNQKKLTDLALLGQSPKVAIIACCDSRVDPAVITDSTPGELFMLRNVANLVPPNEGEGAWHGTSAALQFAVSVLEVEHVVVLGHARCGGIKSLMEGWGKRQGEKFIANWMDIAAEAGKRAHQREDLLSAEEKEHACELYAIEISLANLETFPWIKDRVDQNKLQLHGWYYDLMEGDLQQLDSATGTFFSL